MFASHRRLRNPSHWLSKHIAQAGSEGTNIICFPECYVPGYRVKGKQIPPPDPTFLNRAWGEIAQSAAKTNIAVILWH
jgi:predicted amidohydrolase